MIHFFKGEGRLCGLWGEERNGGELGSSLVWEQDSLCGEQGKFFPHLKIKQSNAY